MADTLATETVTWLWQGYLGLDGLCFIDGDMGTGKSSLLADLAARVTRGRKMPDGTAGKKGAVIWLAGEEEPRINTIPRLRAANADLSKVMFFGYDKQRSSGVSVQFPASASSLEAAIRKLQARLIVVDPFLSFFASGLNPFIEQDVRLALAPVAAVAQRTRCCVAFARHPNKNSSQKKLYRGGGSAGVAAIARTVMWLAEHPNDPGIRLLSVIKSNLAAFPPQMAFRVEPHGATSVVKWLGAAGAVEDDPVADAESKGKRMVLDDAKRLILAALKTGPRPSKEVLREAEDSGIGSRTLMSAKSVLAVRSRRKLGQDGKAFWEWSIAKEGG